MSPTNFAQFATPDLAEAAFYQAFAHCDLKAMEGIWAHENAVCIHPGSDALLGHEAVMSSWGNIFSGAMPPGLNYHVVSRTVNNDLAIHVVQEFISAQDASGSSNTNKVLTTNIYRRENGTGWRMLEHHASVPRISIETGAGEEASSFDSPGRHTLQ
jgi:ketosteroid isomerase-like protein